jgi:hypothetical protein
MHNAASKRARSGRARRSATRHVASLALAWLTLTACGEDTASTTSGTAASSGSSATGSSSSASGGSGGSGGSDVEPKPPAVGTSSLDACLGESGVDERCTLVTDASACTAEKCSKLVVVFSGGEMGCVSGKGYKDVLAGYAARGYAAVCINYFETPEGSGAKPYVDEASRIDLALREATTGDWAKAYWTGEDLLLEGISHGATAPVIAMARTTLDDAPHWRGSRFTAGCFFDGVYDTLATANLLATGAVGKKPCTVPVSYERLLERYCGPGATAATCDLASNAKAKEDSITGVSPDAFALRDFRMVECGSELLACTGDIIAGAPIESLCKSLDAASTHTCDFGSLPKDGHLTCHANEYDSCRVWFEGLLPK